MLRLALAQLIAAFAALLLAAPAVGGAYFKGLGDVAPDFTPECAAAVSADGTTVVGAGRASAPGSRYEAYVWSADTGLTRLGVLPGRDDSFATGVSADGSVVVGTSERSGSPEERGGFRWTADEGVLEDLGTIINSTEANGVSADGMYVVGRSGNEFDSTGNHFWAYRWSEALGMQILAGGIMDPDGNVVTIANAASADGSVIVGQDRSGFYAVKWNDGEFISIKPPGSYSSAAEKISSDGSVIVGWMSEGSYGQAFRWTESGMERLRPLPLPGTTGSNATGVSSGGSVIVGLSFANRRPAFIWDEASGMRDLKQALEDDYGLDLTGWELDGGPYLSSFSGCGGTDVSDDGFTLVGSGTDPSGDPEAWIAVLREPAIAVGIDIKPGSNPNSINPTSWGVIPVAILGSDSFHAADVDTATLAFGPDDAAPAHNLSDPAVFADHVEDVNGDGFPDLLAHFRTEETGIVFGTMTACLHGMTLDGKALSGCDAVRTVPDMDGDKLLDAEEAAIGTDALNPDTDGDGFTDGDEVLVLQTDPLNAHDPTPAQTRARPSRRRR
jgi:probable HAF family extracellular repeat protein